MPHALMLFAAGLGTRMGALTASRPKPLIEVAGRALIDHALDQARGVPLSRIVANVHYLPDQMRAHLRASPDILLSDESGEILETGGGLRRALPLLGDGPVFTLNTDAVWTGDNALAQLAAAWNPAQMDALLLLLPATQATGYRGAGDFLLDAQGRITRAKGAPGLAYLGAQILKTERLHDISEQVFSLNRIWDLAIAEGRAFGIVHNGGWCDVGRPEGIAEAEALLANHV
ncbi:MobA-like NTP transferase domain-containing protein [Gemmobacter aquatilis]|uniref:MobA-like NTP transferase domain-containing protein n=1 Tax=Gemmobacter aquatilis TaxID=933059 RepID=A0A1H7YZB7_9RHOB|nr:nucleotidyltransferase family protein [Gemmobacter aquatilis]SEM50579.1 MobA-like NTP transferase domain-containing protein [Gemmobacter aquatilis]